MKVFCFFFSKKKAFLCDQPCASAPDIKKPA